MASRSAKELEKELAAVTKKLRELEKATTATTKAEKKQAKSRAPTAGKGMMAAAAGALRGSARGLAATGIRGLADPLLTTAELESQLGKKAGGALGSISIAGFRLGPELGSLAGEMGPDILRAAGAKIPGLGTLTKGFAGALEGVRDVLAPVLEAKQRRQFLERGTQAGATARLQRLAEVGVEITPEMAAAMVKPYLHQQERRLRAAVMTRRAVDELGIDGSE